jgi:hypothetical protein
MIKVEEYEASLFLDQTFLRLGVTSSSHNLPYRKWLRPSFGNRLNMKVRPIPILFESLTLTLLIAITACASPNYQSELTIDQIKARALNALELIETYKLDMAMSMSVLAGSESAMDHLSSITTGAIDKASKKMSVSVETKSTANLSPG